MSDPVYTLSQARDRIEELERGLDQAREIPDPITLLAGWIAEDFCEGEGPPEIDGADLEEIMKETGFVYAETYDVEKHGPELQGIGLEPGEDHVLIFSAKVRKARKVYQQWAREQEKRRCPKCKASGAELDGSCPVASRDCPTYQKGQAAGPATRDGGQS